MALHCASIAFEGLGGMGTQQQTEPNPDGRVRSTRPLSKSHTLSGLSDEAETARFPPSLTPRQ
jgi:hypothetical protein